jgi:rubrerythrin
VEKKDVSEYKIDKIPDLKISDFVDDQEFSPDMDYAAALRLAIKREEHAFKLYNHIGSGTENPELKKLFSVLAQEESKHKLRLESEYDENVLMWA